MSSRLLLPRPVINKILSFQFTITTIYQHHLLSFLCFLFFSLLSLSFLPHYPFSRFISIVDDVFLFFYLCSSLALFKINQSLVLLIHPSRQKTVPSSSSSEITNHNNNANVTIIIPVKKNKCPKFPRSKTLPVSPSFEESRRHHSGRISFNAMDNSPPGSNDLSNVPSPLTKSPWSSHINLNVEENAADGGDSGEEFSPNVLLGSLVREEGHIYSLAASGELLYTGSDSKNIRVWKNHREFSGFKSNSGLVKAIIISNDRIFTGHQDGKVRVWRVSSKDPTVHKRVVTLPTLKDIIKNSIKPSNYINETRKKNGINSLWLKHLDAISCLGMSEDGAYLYSASWDKTFKVWRVSDFKCLESITAHDDAVNALVAGFDGLVFTGSADGSVKVWRRELQGKGTKHFFSQTLLKQECAITALAVNPPEATVVYCGSSDGLVNFWERDTQLSHGGVLRGHKLAVLCLVSVGSLVFSGSADMGICVWRRSGIEHTCLSQLTGHTGPVKCLAAEEDSSLPAGGGGGGGGRTWTLYSGSLDKSVKMWRVSEQAPPMGWNNGSSSSKPPVSTLTVAPTFSSQGNRISEAKC